ncbi:hypothetical protein BgiBS90_012358 [Biomphalaria glabrata]|nr:hypothetical protein BgiBS90_012358 [Biomphalaria glabrata]
MNGRHGSGTSSYQCTADTDPARRPTNERQTRIRRVELRQSFHTISNLDEKFPSSGVPPLRNPLTRDKVREIMCEADRRTGREDGLKHIGCLNTWHDVSLTKSLFPD